MNIFNAAINILVQKEPINKIKLAQVYGNRGMAFFNIGEYDNALSDCNQALELDNTFWGSYACHGFAQYGLQNYESAIADFDEAITLGPPRGNPRIYNARAVAYENNNDYQLAFSDYDKAIELDPDEPKFYYNRGLLHKELGNIEEAINDFKSYLALS
ncbi:MAG: tetratricopeptide repeat protein, partial [Candidatus Hodarchaeota archaeon]